MCIRDRTTAMAKVMNLDDTTHASFAGAIDDMLASLDIPTQLSALGVGDDRIDELAQKSLGDAAAATNPRESSLVQLTELLASRL